MLKHVWTHQSRVLIKTKEKISLAARGSVLPVTFWLLAPLVTFVLALSTFVLFEYEKSIFSPLLQQARHW